MTKNETTLPFSIEEEKIISDFHKKQTKKILLTLSAFLAVIGFIMFIFLSLGSSDDKKENLRSTIDYTHNESRQLSQKNLKDSKSNYIKAVYNCPYNYNKCKFYTPISMFVTQVYSITINGIKFVYDISYFLGNSGVKEVTFEFRQKIKSMYRFFYKCEYLISVDFSDFDTSELTNMNEMFFYCTNLKTITWGPNFSTSKVTDMESLFQYCFKLESIDLSSFDTGKVKTFRSMFSGCSSLKEFNASSFDTSSLNDTVEMFRFCDSLTSVDISSFKFSKSASIASMFLGCKSLKTVNFGDNFDASNIIYMGDLFGSCSSLETINFGDNFDTRNVISMNFMFQRCSSLKTINFGNKFDTRNVIYMKEMFKDCTSLETLNLSNFNTTALTYADSMFENCENLVSIDQKFTSESLISTNSMFKNCKKLKKIDLSGIVGQDLKSVSGMFTNCNSLTSIDLRNLEAEKIEFRPRVFYNLPGNGNFIYNSLKLNLNFLYTLPSGWTKTDASVSK